MLLSKRGTKTGQEAADQPFVTKSRPQFTLLCYLVTKVLKSNQLREIDAVNDLTELHNFFFLLNTCVFLSVDSRDFVTSGPT